MEATLPASALRPWGKLMQCLAKIGEQVTLEATRSKLHLSTVNASSSAFVLCCFSRQYFESFTFTPDAASLTPEAARCRVLTKSLVSVFRSKQNGEKAVETCKLTLEGTVTEQDPALTPCRLSVRMGCKHGVAKHYRIFYEPCEALYAVYAKDQCPNRWLVSPKLMGEWMSHFSTKLDEITMICSPESIVIQSFAEGGFAAIAEGTSARDAIKQSLQTQFQVDVEDFDVYEVRQHVELTFNFKEFRAFLGFAEQLNLPLMTYFDVPGKPVLFSLQSTDHMGVDLVLATLTETMSLSAGTSTPPTQGSLGTNIPHSLRHSPAGSGEPSTSQGAVPLPPTPVIRRLPKDMISSPSLVSSTSVSSRDDGSTPLSTHPLRSNSGFLLHTPLGSEGNHNQLSDTHGFVQGSSFPTTGGPPPTTASEHPTPSTVILRTHRAARPPLLFPHSSDLTSTEALVSTPDDAPVNTLQPAARDTQSPVVPVTRSSYVSNSAGTLPPSVNPRHIRSRLFEIPSGLNHPPVPDKVGASTPPGQPMEEDDDEEELDATPPPPENIQSLF
ncbi:hypothetical protein IWQ61_001073 [Dispira simplex]|nr:hypothetical protein IWQ61_001073 [Dispira simplex]